VVRRERIRVRESFADWVLDLCYGRWTTRKKGKGEDEDGMLMRRGMHTDSYIF
jgi:hypothetical protein